MHADACTYVCNHHLYSCLYPTSFFSFLLNAEQDFKETLGRYPRGSLGRKGKSFNASVPNHAYRLPSNHPFHTNTNLSVMFFDPIVETNSAYEKLRNKK